MQTKFRAHVVFSNIYVYKIYFQGFKFNFWNGMQATVPSLQKQTGKLQNTHIEFLFYAKREKSTFTESKNVL